MKRLACVTLLILLSTSLLFGSWAMVPLDQLVAEADLIVVGTLYSAEENDEGIGNGLIRVNEIVAGRANTLDDLPLQVGDRLKIKWADNWACASGMHMARRGEVGVWLLDASNDGTVTAAYPGKFEAVESLREIRRHLRQSKPKGKVTVDVSQEEIEPLSIPVKAAEIFVAEAPLPAVDFNYSPRRAAFVLLIAAVLYLLLYRNRFGIRD